MTAEELLKQLEELTQKLISKGITQTRQTTDIRIIIDRIKEAEYLLKEHIENEQYED